MIEFMFILQMAMIAFIFITFIFCDRKPTIAIISATLLFIALGLGMVVSVVEVLGVMK